MAELDLKTKQIYNSLLYDYEAYIRAETEEFIDRYNKAKAAIQHGMIDAPYMPGAVYIGNEKYYNSDHSDLSRPIYKQTVPGYFYRRKINDVPGNNDSAAILVSCDPNYLKSDNSSEKSKRILYMTAYSGSDISDPSGATGGNNMFPMTLCGTNVYVYFVGGCNENFEYIFVPTIEAYASNVRPDNYLVKVGMSNETVYNGYPVANSIPRSSSLNNPNPEVLVGTRWERIGGTYRIVDVMEKVFNGEDWRAASNFKVMFGQKWANEDSMKFTDASFKTALIDERKAYLRTRARITGVSPGYYPGY